jgi:hypothetical protein
MDPCQPRTGFYYLTLITESEVMARPGRCDETARDFDWDIDNVLAEIMNYSSLKFNLVLI